MAHLDHLYALREEHIRRLKRLELQQATYGISVDPRITNEIEDILKEISTLETRISAHSELLTLHEQRAKGLEHVLRLLGKGAHYDQALEYQKRMLANIERVRDSGDSPSDLAEHKQLIEQINTLTKQTLNKTFNHFMRRSARSTIGRSPSPPSSSAAPPGSDGAGSSSTISIQNQNNVTGDHNTINNASYQNIYHGPVGSVSDDSE